jgi:hypothetical protein
LAYEATRDANTMTISGQDIQDWKGKLGDWLAARWRGLIVAVLLLFVLNNLAGLLAGSLGLIAFANRIAGRVLSAQSVVQQVKQIVSDPDDREEEV